MDTMRFDTYSKGQLMAALACIEDSRSSAEIRAHHARGVTTYRFKELPSFNGSDLSVHTLEGRNALIKGARAALRRVPASVFDGTSQMELLP